jgi:ADP-heptose:LPS heptosyltransferase
MYDNPRSLLVVHIAGMGETVMALPALRALRQQLPQTHITVASAVSSAEILKLSDCADEILTVGRLRRAEAFRPRGLYRSVGALRSASRLSFDLAVELKRNAESAVMMNFARPRQRLNAGTGHQQLRSAFERLTGALRNDKTIRHQTQRYLELLAPLGIRPMEAFPQLTTNRLADEKIEKLFENRGLPPGSLLVGVHPGSGDVALRWSAEHFMRIAERFVHNFHARILVLGGPQEHGIARQIVSALPKNQAVAFESLKLDEFASVLARLSLLMANHSGPAHLAAALGTPVIAASINGNIPRREFSARDILGRSVTHIRGAQAEDVYEDDVYEAACQVLKTSRADFLSVY